MSNITKAKQKEIREMINLPAFKKRLMALFENDEKKAEKFKATLLNISLDPSLSSCHPSSIIKAALSIAEVGLNLAPAMGQAYLVRYKNDVTPVIGYKGWLKLAAEAGLSVKAYPVFDCDEFQYEITTVGEVFNLVPNYEQREEDNPEWVDKHLQGIVVAVKEKDSNFTSFYFVSIKKIKQLASKSPAKDSKFSPYKEWLLEMYMAKAIKYVLSKTAMPEKIAEVVHLENQAEIENKKEDEDIELELEIMENKIKEGNNENK